MRSRYLSAFMCALVPVGITGYQLRTWPSTSTPDVVEARPGAPAAIADRVQPQAVAFTSAAAQTRVFSSLAPPSIDGDKTPELIPDDVAWRHFIMAAAYEGNATAERQAQRAGYLRLTRLDEADTAVVVANLEGVREALSSIAQRQRSLAAAQHNALGALMALRTEKAELLSSSRAKVQGALSAEGAQRLEEFVQEHVKRRIRIYTSFPE